MKLLKAIYSCRFGKDHIGLLIKCFSTISWTFLLAILGGFCGVVVNNGFFSESAIELLSIGITFLIITLKDNDHVFSLPICPLISHKCMAIFRLLNAIVSASNIILLCILVPFYFVIHGNLGTFVFFANCIFSNIIISLIALNLEPFFSKNKRVKLIILFLSISFCSFIVLSRTSGFLPVVDVTSIHLLLIILIPFVCLLLIGSYYWIRNYYPEFYNSGASIVKTDCSYKMRGVLAATIPIIVKQYFRCPAYKKLYPSAFALLLIGAFLCRLDGTEYIGATLFTSAYALSLLQYSSSSLSKSPDLLFSGPYVCQGFLYAFSLINVIVSSFFCIFITLYIKFVTCKSIIPVFSIWGLVCGPVSKIILTSAVFPVKVDLWSQNPDINRTPIQVFTTAVSAFVIFITAMLIQYKTVESSAIIGILSLVSFLTYHRHISFLETKMCQRKYIIINSLR